jgi:hypothetical protein
LGKYDLDLCVDLWWCGGAAVPEALRQISASCGLKSHANGPSASDMAILDWYWDIGRGGPNLFGLPAPAIQSLKASIRQLVRIARLGNAQPEAL